MSRMCAMPASRSGARACRRWRLRSCGAWPTMNMSGARRRSCASCCPRPMSRWASRGSRRCASTRALRPPCSTLTWARCLAPMRRASTSSFRTAACGCRCATSSPTAAWPRGPGWGGGGCVKGITPGPASAPMAGRHIAQPLGLANFITVDMGGTSFDITLTHQGQTQVTKDNDFLRYRIGTPMIQVESLGAGGGSIGWIDSMGLLNVGPQSAGASPGPACYMRGGTRPTVTDANVALGYLNPQALLGGRLAIDAAASRQAIAAQLAGPLGITPEKAAYGIFSIVNNNMVNG